MNEMASPIRYLLAAVAFCTLSAGAQPIKLGELNSYKTFPAFLEAYKHGMELATEQINQSGGLLGRPVELIVRDDTGSPGDAVRVAEELVLKDMTTGAGNDLERATDLARKMVCEWGMSEKMGPLTFGKQNEQVFLGRELGSQRDFSDQIAMEIDEEVKRLVMENYERAKRLLTENMATLKRLAEALLEKEVLDSADIDNILMQPTSQAVPA
jgi:hypothetical protein